MYNFVRTPYRCQVLAYLFQWRKRVVKKVTLFIDGSMQAQLRKRAQDMDVCPGFSTALEMYSALLDLALNDYSVGTLNEKRISLEFYEDKVSKLSPLFEVCTRAEASMRYVSASNPPLVRLELKCFTKHSKRSLGVYAFDFDEATGKVIDMRGYVHLDELNPLMMGRRP